MTDLGPARGEGLLLIAPQSQTALTYARAAMFNPVSLSLVAFVVCAGLGYAGVLGATILTAVFCGVCATATRNRYVRDQLDHYFELQLRQRRDTERMRRLKSTGPLRQQQYVDLRNLVEEIERTDPAEARRFELDDLVEHFVSLATMHQRCVESLRLAGSSDLPRSLSPDATRSIRRREILARRIQLRDACVRKIDHIADELEAVDELVRLVAQRVACPQEVDGELDREIERRLWELDEVDTAMSQLSA